jgi:hypothetical protein
MTGVLFASKTGNVGIGTTTPETKLDVIGNNIQCSNQGRFKGWFPSGGGSGLGMEIGVLSNEGYINCYDRTGNSYRNMNFVSASGAFQNVFKIPFTGAPSFNNDLSVNGNVGIGTTTPTEKLDVAGNAKFTGSGGIILNPGAGAASLVISRSGQFTNNVLGFAPYQDNNIGLASGGGAQITMGKTELSFSTYAPTGSLGLINPIERMKITSIGVGINQPNPSYKLQVEGSTTSTSGSEVLGWFNNQTGTCQVAFRIGAKTAYIQNHNGLGGATFTDQLSNAISFGVSSAAAPIQLFNGSPAAARMTILSDATGSIGIRTSAPTSILDVNGDTFRLRTARTPASSGAAGNSGDICWDTNYMYVCVNTNTWKRTALSTWS